MTQTLHKNPRIEVVDALRGFAVMAIILVHNLEHFIFPVYPTDSPGWLNTIDQGVLNSIFTLFAGKAYAILPFYSDSPSIFKPTTKRSKTRISAIVFCGDWYYW